MKTVVGRACWAAVLIAWCATARIASGAESTPPATADSAGQQVAVIPVPNGLEMDNVESAILKPAVRLKWQIQQKSDGQIVCHYAHGPNEATLTIKYDRSQITIFAVGKARGGGLPMRWIERLKQDVGTALGQELVLKG